MRPAAPITSGKSKAWVPEGFAGYKELYPETATLRPEPDAGPSIAFAGLWHAGREAIESILRPKAAKITVVFVRGYLGRYMPGNLSAPCLAMRRAGFDAFIVSTRWGGTVSANVEHIAGQLRDRPLRERLVFCGHSRGGLECLSLLAGEPGFSARCAGVVLSQTSRGPSYVLESVLQGRHRERISPRRRLAEDLQRVALAATRESRGGLEMTASQLPALAGKLARIHWPFPVLQTASWSSRPTAWLDSFHERLGEIRPGHAHDGQFFLEDLIWPGLPHVLLPHLDHAQPAMGGFGFDHARYWLANLSLVLS